MEANCSRRYRSAVSRVNICLGILLGMLPFLLAAQPLIPQSADSSFTTYYQQRYSHFRSLPNQAGSIIFMGNSITDGAEWSELFQDPAVLNRGISGDNTSGVLHRLAEVTSRKPEKLFLLIGINDLAKGLTPDSINHAIQQIVAYVRFYSSTTQIFVQSVLPVNDKQGKFSQHVKKNAEILQLNKLLKAGSALLQYHFVDLHSCFAGPDGKLKPELTNDGLHLTATGYQLWKTLVFPLVYALPDKPSLIPEPRQLHWEAGQQFLASIEMIFTNYPEFRQEARKLQEHFRELGYTYSLSEKVDVKATAIRLLYDERYSYNPEAYAIDCGANGITLSAASETGIFRGMITLLQLARDQTAIPYCTIEDSPAFGWRGFLIDVGRNYVSMDGLKKLIDQLTFYKLNVFHFHVTEHLAWRIEVPGFPGLTAPEGQTRNRGAFYSVDEIRELIRYCNERHILFLPEIDMPGHSDAFRKTMGYDMQSDSGKQILKQVLRSLITTYGFTQLHIGADEVKIRDTSFLPDMTQLLEQLGVKVHGWQPGGNFPNTVIRQLWVGGAGIKKELETLPVIDSKHLYLNHMDPLESVITIYMRSILDTVAGDELRKGATLCLWHDRAVQQEKDLWQMNPVYPGLLSFAERIWTGGGPRGWRTAPELPGEPRSMEFDVFERKLMAHRNLYFRSLPFPYTAQRDVEWNLVGPYANKGDISAVFEPEKNPDPTRYKTAFTVRGGTVILRHWWAPLVSGVLPEPIPNTTWYAYRNIWSDTDRMGKFWIGFNDISRSVLATPPPKSYWDRKGSRIWFNNQEVPAPQWKHAGVSAILEDPLTDEGYSYRNPVELQLHKGWNLVWIKCPVGSFQPGPGGEPVKWMFTFIEAGN